MNTIIVTIVLLSKNLLMPIIPSLTEKIESSHKALKFKVGDRVRITKYKNILGKGYIKNWLWSIFVIHSVPRSNP